MEGQDEANSGGNRLDNRKECSACLWTPMMLYLGAAGYFHYQKKNIGHFTSLLLSSTCLLLAGHYLNTRILTKKDKPDPDDK